MTKHDLKQYRSLKLEINDLERRIAKGEVVSDVVTGSSANYPYTQHPINICGVDTKLTKKYIQQKKKLTRECLEIEQWMDSVDDSLVRRIIRHRFIDGFSWRQIANRVGGENTEDSVRKAVERYLQRD